MYYFYYFVCSIFWSCDLFIGCPFCSYFLKCFPFFSFLLFLLTFLFSLFIHLFSDLSCFLLLFKSAILFLFSYYSVFRLVFQLIYSFTQLFLHSCFISNISEMEWLKQPHMLWKLMLQKINILRTNTYCQRVKSTGKLKYWCSTITLPLASYKQSLFNSHQSSLFCRVSAQVFQKFHLHVSPEHGNLYINETCVLIIFDWSHFMVPRSDLQWHAYKLSSKSFRHGKNLWAISSTRIGKNYSGQS